MAPTGRSSALPVLRPSRWRFPDPATAGEEGLVGIGADLEPATLLDAYRRGIFPWPHPGAPLPWFSPDPRGVIPLDGLAVSRSLRDRSCSSWVRGASRESEELRSFEPRLARRAGPDHGPIADPALAAGPPRLRVDTEVLLIGA